MAAQHLFTGAEILPGHDPLTLARHVHALQAALRKPRRLHRRKTSGVSRAVLSTHSNDDVTSAAAAIYSTVQVEYSSQK